MKIVRVIKKKDSSQSSNKIQEYFDEANKSMVKVGDLLQKALQEIKADKSMTSEEAEDIDYIRSSVSNNIKALDRYNELLKRYIEKRLS